MPIRMQVRTLYRSTYKSLCCFMYKVCAVPAQLRSVVAWGHDPPMLPMPPMPPMPLMCMMIPV